MWITTAWQSFSPEVTVKGFKNCCISSAMYEINDDDVDSGEEDGDVRNVYEEDEGTDYEDRDCDTDWLS